MLIVSTALSLGSKLLPQIGELIAGNAEGRSLGSINDVSTLAQYAYEALEKYQALNEHQE